MTVRMLPPAPPPDWAGNPYWTVSVVCPYCGATDEEGCSLDGELCDEAQSDLQTQAQDFFEP